MLIFFEIDKVNVERYYFNRLRKNFDLNQIVVVLEEVDDFYKFKEAYPNIQVFLFSDWLRKYCKNFQNKYVIINGNRIPDLLMAKVSKENCCKIIYIQHGLYVRFMKRQYTLFFRNIKKTIRYACYALRLKKGLDLFKVHVLGYDRKIIANNSMIYPDYALVFSEYWKLWHVKNYFFNMVHNYHYLKNNDSNRKTKKVVNTAVYCYQTLLEDGRIEIDYFKNLMNQIIKSVESSGLKLVVKGHPRMIKSSIEFFENKGIPIINDIIPVGGIVIGHYSTLLLRWVYEGDKLFLIPLKGHIIPNYLKELATAICSPIELLDALKSNQIGKNKLTDFKERSDYYFNFSGNNSIEYIDEFISIIKNK